MHQPLGAAFILSQIPSQLELTRTYSHPKGL